MKKLAALIAGMALSLPVMAQEATDTVAAQYPGGAAALNEYLATNLKYPQAAASNCIEGVVHVSFNVKPDGTLDQFAIVRLIDPDLETEAMRLAKGMPAWQPATVDGKPVDSKSQIQVVFSLSE
ncbi:MAG: energy transducer TonB [Muribaculaceae bacterium]|nr:energy transducer TonB [Muribaculaceae bacterium]